MSRILDAIADRTIHQIANATRQVASGYRFDIAAVTGRSGEVSRRLLEAAKIPSSSIVHINASLNQGIYLQNRLLALSEIRDQLRLLGIDIATNPRLLIVDEFMFTGAKAEGYINVFKRLGLLSFKFAPIVSRPHTLISQGQIKTDSKKLFTPVYESAEVQEDALRVMDTLTDQYKESQNTQDYMSEAEKIRAQEDAEQVENVLANLTQAVNAVTTKH